MNYLKQDQLEYGQWYWVRTASDSVKPFDDSWIVAQYTGYDWSWSGEYALEYPVQAVGPIKNPDQFKDVNLDQLVDDFWVRSGGWFNSVGGHENAEMHHSDLMVFVAAIAGQAIIDSGDPHLLQKMNDEIKMLQVENEGLKTRVQYAIDNHIEVPMETQILIQKLKIEVNQSRRHLIEAQSRVTELMLKHYTPPKQLSPNGFMLFGAWFKRVFKL